MGHLHYLTGRTEEAQDCYERTLAYTTEASDVHAIYLRLASIYLEKGEVSLVPVMLSPSRVSILALSPLSVKSQLIFENVVLVVFLSLFRFDFLVVVKCCYTRLFKVFVRTNKNVRERSWGKGNTRLYL